jgi:amidase
MSTKNWKDLAAAKKAHQQTTIPRQWIIANPPPKDQLDVSALPESYGVLSAKDVEITNSQVDVLLAKLADGTWSAMDVTTAFSKRAIIAHQLVWSPSLTLSRFRGSDDPWHWAD